jgi:TetR/AcrR family transcriptional regulator
MSGGDRRHQLLETALEVFSRKGFEGATTKEIAARAGVTEAIIFRHFPTKQELYAAVLDYKTQSCALEEWLTETKGYMDRNDDVGLLRAIAAQILKSYRTDPRFERVVLFAALEGHESGLAHNRKLAIPVFELLRDYIIRRQREGAIRPYNPGAILAAIAGMAQHYAMMTQMFGFEAPDMSDDEAIETFTRIAMHGIQSADATKAGTKV